MNFLDSSHKPGRGLGSPGKIQRPPRKILETSVGEHLGAWKTFSWRLGCIKHVFGLIWEKWLFEIFAKIMSFPRILQPFRLPASKLQKVRYPQILAWFLQVSRNGRETTTIFENLGKFSQTQSVYFLGWTTCLGHSAELPATPTPTLALFASATVPHRNKQSVAQNIEYSSSE